MGELPSISTSLRVIPPRLPISPRGPGPRLRARHKARARRRRLPSPTASRGPCHRRSSSGVRHGRCVILGRASRGSTLSTPPGGERRRVREEVRNGLPGSGVGSEARAERPLREQGVLGECGTMTRACRETPGGCEGEWRTTTLPWVSRGAARSLVRLTAPGGFGRAERHPSAASAAPGSGGVSPRRTTARAPRSEGPTARAV